MSVDWPLELEDVTPLSEFRARVNAQPLPNAERDEIVGQAAVLLEHLYAHRDQKGVYAGGGPLSRLAELRERLAGAAVDDAQFHREMVEIFATLRDLHTSYVLPAAFHDRVAFLPFSIEAYGSANDPHYIVTHVRGDALEPGVPVLRYNDQPVRLAAAAQAERSPGANEAARRARGIARLTSRYVADAYLPDEDEAIVAVLDGDDVEREYRFPWCVGRLPSAAQRRSSGGGSTAWRVGADRGGKLRRRVRKALFTAPSAEAGGGPDLVAYRDLEGCGYLRIYDFPEDEHDAFLADVGDRLRAAAPKRLIIDVRGNPGGLITAAEGLLFLLTGRRLELPLYEFPVSELARSLVFNVSEFKPWRRPMTEAQETADRHSAPKRLVSRTMYAALAQRFEGPIVVIVDAESYSATDMFAAAIQDQGLGKILAIADRTGAGGATVAEHGALIAPLRGHGGELGPMPVRSLPSGASFTIAIRRSVRSGDNVGRKLEGIGVQPDGPVHELTRDDLCEHNRDLIAAAQALVEQQKWPELGATWEDLDTENSHLVIEAANVDHVQIVDGVDPLAPIWEHAYNGGELRVPSMRVLAEAHAGYDVRIVGLRDRAQVVSIPYPFTSSHSSNWQVRER